MRRHNILSLRPHLDIYVKTKSDEDHTIELKNVGAGPAFIQSVCIRANGRTQTILSKSDFWSAISIMMPTLLSAQFEYSKPDRQTAIGPGDTFNLLNFPRAKNQCEIFYEFDKAMDSVEIEIKYQCLYEKSYVAKYDGKDVAG